MRDVFVVGICAIGVFLISYNMYRNDYIAARFAGTFAIGVALLPTRPDEFATRGQNIVGNLHLVCAAAFFLILAYFSLALFTKTDPLKIPTRRKLQRNVIYKICGVTILVCLALMILAAILPNDTLRDQFQPLFWLESIATLAFGISWLIKGEAILEDKKI
jgi:TRAP-type C4-dicarboxylate transport system permease small subunit